MPYDSFPWFKDQPVKVIYNLLEEQLRDEESRILPA